MKGKECKGGKKSKKHITNAFYVASSGKMEKPVVMEI